MQTGRSSVSGTVPEEHERRIPGCTRWAFGRPTSESVSAHRSDYRGITYLEDDMRVSQKPQLLLHFLTAGMLAGAGFALAEPLQAQSVSSGAPVGRALA